MFGLMIIATTLLARGVNNMQEAAVLFAAPPVALANYTYHYLEDTGFNYTDFMKNLPSLPSAPDTLFDMSYWMSPQTMESMRSKTEYLIREVPVIATEVPKQIYERFMAPSRQANESTKVDVGMVFVAWYLVSLFTLATVIWIMKPGSKQAYEEIDSDHILVRKRKRVPNNRFYEEGRMQLRSMTTADDVFYELD